MRAGMGVGEWFRRLNYERLFFMLHRLTAIYLVLYIFPRPYLVLLYGSWEEALKLDMTPIGKILAAIFVFSILLHGLNGLRLVLIELGIIKGWPVRDPVSPRPALRVSAAHRLLVILTVIGTIVGSALGIYLVAYGAEEWP